MYRTMLQKHTVELVLLLMQVQVSPFSEESVIFIFWFSLFLLGKEKQRLEWKMHGMTDIELLHTSGDD